MGTDFLFLCYHQGLFSELDTSSSGVLADYIAYAIIAPCKMVLGFWWNESKVTLANKHLAMPIKFRVQSAFSSCLIKTYKKLGFVAPIPVAMKNWSPKLYKLLTVDFWGMKDFQKGTGSSSFTSANIPVLLAVLVYLAHKSVIKLGQSLTSEVFNLFNTYGCYKQTAEYRTPANKKNWPESVTTTWAESLRMQFTISGSNPEPRREMDLYQIISLLLYGTDDEDDGKGEELHEAAEFRAMVEEAIQDLTVKKIRKMLEEKDWATAIKYDAEAQNHRNPIPFLNGKEYDLIQKAESNEERIDKMVLLRKDYLAKALNLSIHIEIASMQEEDEVEENDTSLRFLQKPAGKEKKFSKCPKPFLALAPMEQLLTTYVKRKVDYFQEPTSIWAELDRVEVSDWSLPADHKNPFPVPGAASLKDPPIPRKDQASAGSTNASQEPEKGGETQDPSAGTMEVVEESATPDETKQTGIREDPHSSPKADAPVESIPENDRPSTPVTTLQDEDEAPLSKVKKRLDAKVADESPTDTSSESGGPPTPVQNDKVEDVVPVSQANTRGLGKRSASSPAHKKPTAAKKPKTTKAAPATPSKAGGHSGKGGKGGAGKGNGRRKPNKSPADGKNLG
jgi:hypothetical protein